MNMAMVEILPNLFLGGANHAFAKDMDMVINCTVEVGFNKNSDAKKYRLGVQNDSSENLALLQMLLKSPDLFDEISKSIRCDKNVLIHCCFGKQRAAAVMACFLIYMFNISVDHAVRFIQMRMPGAFQDNNNFIETIHGFYLHGHSVQ